MKINNISPDHKADKSLRLAFLFLSILFFFYLFLKTNLYPRDYTYTEWFINYEGGFVKRGLGGQIALEISNLVQLNLKLSILLADFFFKIPSFQIFLKPSSRNLNIIIRTEIPTTADPPKIKVGCGPYKSAMYPTDGPPIAMLPLNTTVYIPRTFPLIKYGVFS